jgi:hypothetical protein
MFVLSPHFICEMALTDCIPKRLNFNSCRPEACWQDLHGRICGCRKLGTTAINYDIGVCLEQPDFISKAPVFRQYGAHNSPYGWVSNPLKYGIHRVITPLAGFFKTPPAWSAQALKRPLNASPVLL